MHFNGRQYSLQHEGYERVGIKRRYGFGVLGAASTQKHHRLCWSQASAAVEDFNVEIDGEFDVIGPFLGDYACTLGLHCTFQLSGSGLTGDNGLLVSSSRCGSSQAPLTSNGLVNPVSPRQTPPYGHYNAYSFGAPVAGAAGVHFLCCSRSGTHAQARE